MVDLGRFLEALGQQLGADRERLALKSATKRSPPPGCLIEVEVAEGTPPSAVIAENARGIMSRSQSQHRFIAGYAVVSIACQAGATGKTEIDSLMHRIRSRTWRDRIRVPLLYTVLMIRVHTTHTTQLLVRCFHPDAFFEF